MFWLYLKYSLRTNIAYPPLAASALLFFLSPLTDFNLMLFAPFIIGRYYYAVNQQFAAGVKLQRITGNKLANTFLCVNCLTIFFSLLGYSLGYCCYWLTSLPLPTLANYIYVNELPVWLIQLTSINFLCFLIGNKLANSKIKLKLIIHLLYFIFFSLSFAIIYFLRHLKWYYQLITLLLTIIIWFCDLRTYKQIKYFDKYLLK